MIIPRPGNTGMRCYYKMEDTTVATDSSGHGNTLTRAGITIFGDGAFASGKSLYMGPPPTTIGGVFKASGNVLSSTNPAEVTISMFFTQRELGSSNLNARLFEIMTNPAGGAGLRMGAFYNFSGADVIYSFFIIYSTSGARIDYTIPLGSEQHVFTFTYLASSNEIQMYDNGQLVGTDTGVGTLVCIASPTVISIGATYDKGLVNWGLTDEFIIEERIWSVREIKKYYTKIRGFFV